jgi:hypothetical protein
MWGPHHDHRHRFTRQGQGTWRCVQIRSRRSCGYVSSKKDGSERLNFTAFYEALLEAKGVSLGEHGNGKGKGGRKLSYVATVQGNGNLLVGKAYTAMLDLEPGDEFEIKLGRKQIRLVPAGAEDEAD